MRQPIAAWTFAATLAAVLLVASPARAEVFYPWCGSYTGFGGGGTNCGFDSMRQCLAAISGAGGHCYRNPEGREAAPVHYRKHHRKHRR